MNKFVMISAAVIGASMTPVAASAAATVEYNSAPAAGWYFGTGNNYTPANTTVLTTDENSQLYLRWHQTGQPAPASVNGVYSFALGTSPISFDWGFTNALTGAGTPSALLTITNVGTGQSVSYNPFSAGNDNANRTDSFGSSSQNSARLSFGFLFGSSFDPNVDATYAVKFDVFDQTGVAGGQSLTATANIGAGVPEPATWAMMMLGFGAMGAVIRRRASTTTRVRYA